jgi:DNA-binding MarR family transcriptional regulator
MQQLAPLNNSSIADKCAAGVLDALPPVVRIVRSHMRSHRNRGLSLSQFRALAFLRAVRVANLSTVADFLNTTLPTASRIVSGLVSKGFLFRRESTSDRRQVDLAVTAKGAAMMESARQATQAMLAKELATLNASDLKAVHHAMRILHSVFGHQPS